MATEYALSKLPIEQTITVKQGTRYQEWFQVYLDGSTLNLSNATVEFIVTDASGSTVYSVTLYAANGDIDEPANGLFAVPIDATNISAGEYQYELWLTIEEGDIYRLPNGLKVCLMAGLFVVTD